MSVVYSEKYKRFTLTTANTAYCFGIDRENNLQHVYWGKKLLGEEDYPDCHEIGQTVGIGKNLENPRNLSLSNFYYPYEANRAVATKNTWAGEG